LVVLIKPWVANNNSIVIKIARGAFCAHLGVYAYEERVCSSDSVNISMLWWKWFL